MLACHEDLDPVEHLLLLRLAVVAVGMLLRLLLRTVAQELDRCRSVAGPLLRLQRRDLDLVEQLSSPSFHLHEAKTKNNLKKSQQLSECLGIEMKEEKTAK